jgi:hypothetical protein
MKKNSDGLIHRFLHNEEDDQWAACMLNVLYMGLISNCMLRTESQHTGTKRDVTKGIHTMQVMQSGGSAEVA